MANTDMELPDAASPERRPFGAVRPRRTWPKVEEAVAVWILRAAAAVSIVTTAAIVITLFRESLSFFADVPIWEFLGGTKWTPLFRSEKLGIEPSFGVLPLVGGTLLVTVIAGVSSLTVGLGAAIFLSEYAPDAVRRAVKPVLEVLAGIPTVVYGFFALTLVTPVVRWLFPDANIFNALSAGLVMGLMIMPMVSTLSEDAMVAVPRALRDGAYALGATRFEVATKIVVPAALPGIGAALILALSRAIGETMIVTIAAGNTPNLTFNPLGSIQAMTAYIVQVNQGESPHGSTIFKTIFAVGLLLFVMTLAMNIAGQWVIKRFRNQY